MGRTSLPNSLTPFPNLDPLATSGGIYVWNCAGALRDGALLATDDQHTDDIVAQ